MATVKVQNHSVMLRGASRVSPSETPVGIPIIFPFAGEVMAFGDSVELDIKVGDIAYFNPSGAYVVGEFLVVDERDVFVAIEKQNGGCEADCDCEDDSDEAELRTIDIYQEIVLERQYQNELWGEKNDDKNTEEDWVSYITEYANGLTERTKDKSFRERLVKVAALAVAALESIDRQANWTLELSEEERNTDTTPAPQ